MTDLTKLSIIKAAAVSQASADKQLRIGGSIPVDNNRARIAAEFARMQEVPEFGPEDYPLPEESALEAAGRGMEEGVKGTANLIGVGLPAGLAAAAESVVGEGGLATRIKEATARKYAENEEHINRFARPEDSFLYSLDKAKGGDYGALLNFVGHGTGYTLSQLGSILVPGGVVAGGVRLAGKKAITKVLSGVVEKEALKLAEKSFLEAGVKATSKEIAERAGQEAFKKQAASTVAKAVGEKAGMGGMSFGLEGGEILGGKAKQSVEEGRALTFGEVGQALTATGLAGAVEYAETLLGLKALKGSLGKKIGANGVDGLKGRAIRGVGGGVVAGTGEGVQEGVQTGIERWGKGQEVFSKEGVHEMIDAAAMGALMSGPATVSGAFTRSENEQKALDEKRAANRSEKLRVNPELDPDFDKKVTEISKSAEEIKKYADPESPDRNETMAIHAMHKRAQDPDLTKTEAISNREDAVNLYNNMVDERASIVAEGQKIMAELKAKADDSGTTEIDTATQEKLTELKAKAGELKVRIERTTPVIESIKQSGDNADDTEALQAFNDAFKKEDGSTSGNVSESVRRVFGSRSGMISLLQNEGGDSNITDILEKNKGSLPETTHNLLKSMSALQTTMRSISERAGQSMGQVQNDILHGNKNNNFKGLVDHYEGISDALSSGNTDLAQKRLDTLSQWVDQRQHRADVFTGMYEAFKKGTEPKPEIQKAFDTINERVSAYRKPYVVDERSGGLVAAIQDEARAAQEGLQVAKLILEDHNQTLSKGTVANAVSPAAQVDTINPPTSEPSADLEQKGEDAFVEAPQLSADEIKKLPLKEAVNLFNAEAQKPRTKATIEYMKLLRDQVHRQRKDTVGSGAKEAPVTTKPVSKADSTKSPEPAKTEPVKSPEVKAVEVKQTKADKAPAPERTPESETKTQEKVDTQKTADADKILRKVGFSVKETLEMDAEEAKQLAPHLKKNIRQLREELKTATGPLREILIKAGVFKRDNLPLNERLTESDRDSADVQKSEFFQINPLEVFGVAENKKNPTIFNQPGSVIEKLKAYHDSLPEAVEITEEMTKEERQIQEINAARRHGMKVLIGFMDQFTQVFNDTFKEKGVYEDGRSFQWKDSLNYFKEGPVTLRKVKQDKSTPVQETNAKDIPEQVKHAMAYAAFNWLTTQASDFNDERAIRKILGLRSSTVLTPEVWPLQRVGNRSVYISTGIGRDVMKLLQIGFDNNRPATLEEHFHTSIGNNILATLQRMQGGKQKEKILVRHMMNSGTSTSISKEDAVTGLQGLANKLMDPDRDIGYISREDLFAKPGGKEKAGSADETFYSRAETEVVKKLIDAHTSIRADVEAAFSLPRNEEEFTFEEPEFSGTEAKLTKSDSKATLEQTANREKNDQTPYVLAQDTFDALNAFPEEYQKMFAGAEDAETQHISKREGVKGKNRGIDRAFDNVKAWGTAAFLHAGKRDIPFFIRSVFQATGRMRQVGTISPQGNKVHRALFSMVSSFVEIDPSNPVHEKMFKETVGLGFGIEASKEETIDQVIQKTDEAMTSPEVKAALVVLDKVDKGDKLDEADCEAMKVAVKKGKEDLHSFKALVEYHKFLKGEKFTTDLFIERDGMANGPFMMSVQFRAEKITRDFLKRMMSTGLSFGSAEYKTVRDHKMGKDPYDSIGEVWNRRLVDLLGSPHATDSEKQVILAISTLLGVSVIDSESGQVLIEHGRKLSKNMTVGATYGAEKSSTVRALSSHILGSVIPDILKKIHESKDSAAAQVQKRLLTDLIVTVSGVRHPWIQTQGNAETASSLTVQLTKAAKEGITKAVEGKYGDALFDAMEEVYGDFRECAKVLNKGIAVLAARYNAALKYYVNQIEGVVTQKDIDAIKEKLKPLLPRVATPMSGSISLFDFEGMDIIEGPENPDDPNFVNTEHTFKNDDPGYEHITKLRGKARAIKALRVTGVKPIPTIIHMLDSMVANTLMGEMGDPAKEGILNVHDAMITGIFFGKKATDIQNKAIYGFMKDYHVATEIHKAMTDTLPKLADFFGSNDKKFQKMLEKEYKTFRVDTRRVPVIDKSGNPVIKQGRQIYKNQPIPYHLIAKEARDAALEIAKGTEQNKRILLDAVTYMNQYFDPAQGYPTGNVNNEVIAGIPIQDLVGDIPVTASVAPHYESSEEVGADIAEDFKTETPEESNEAPGTVSLGSSANSTLSIDPAEYSIKQEIDRENVVNTYDSIKNQGPTQVSSGHDYYLKAVLHSLNAGIIQPLELYLKSNQARTEGKYVSGEKGQIFINQNSGMLNKGIHMSVGEVFTHEFVHAVTEKGLELSDHLQSKVSRLYDLTFKELQRKYANEGWRVFLDNPSMDVADPANTDKVRDAKDQFNYLFRNAGTNGQIKTNAHTGIAMDMRRSNHLHEFMAFSLTNEPFIRFLQGIKLQNGNYTQSTWSKLRGDNIQQTLMNIFQAIIDMFRSKFTDTSQLNAYEEAMHLGRALSRIHQKQKDAKFQKLRMLVGLNGKIRNKANGLVKQAFRKIPNVATYQDAFEILRRDPSLGGDILNEVIYRLKAMDQGIIKSTVQEAWGMTDRLKDYHRKMTRRRRVIDSTKEAVSLAYNSLTNELFSQPLERHEKVTVTKAGFKTDAVLLLDSLGKDRFLEVYKDRKARQAEIDKVLAELKADKTLGQYAHYYDRAAMALGDLIVHGGFRNGEDAPDNALLIAELSGTPKKGTVSNTDAKRVTPLIDQLASLYAINSLTNEQRNGFVVLMEKDMNGVTKTLQLYKKLKETALQTTFQGAPRLMTKGYVKTILNPEVDIQFGTLADEKVMMDAGYTRSVEPLPKDALDPFKNDPMYLYVSRTGRLNSLQSGLFSFTRNRARGTGITRLANALDRTTREGKHLSDVVNASKEKLRGRMFTEKRNPKAGLGHQMIAKVDQYGKTVEYRYVASEHTKDTFLDQVSDCDVVLGNMGAQIIDKEMTPQINEEVVQLLKATYDAEYKTNPAAFVAVGPNVSDPGLAEKYYMLPEKTRESIKRIWGSEKTMYIPKDIMALAFGYRKYSVVEAFMKEPASRHFMEKMVVQFFDKLSKGDRGKAVRRANTAQQVAIELAHMAKDNIIVKSFTLTVGNFGSNFVYLGMRGVPINTIVTKGWEAFKYGLQYQADTLKANKLSLRRDLLKGDKSPGAVRELQFVEKELMQVKHSLARNPVSESIESGLMPQLVDDVDIQGQKNYFPGLVERTIDKGTAVLPTHLKKAGDQLFLAQDTQAYQVLNNLVKLTDFVGRHVLYRHLVDTGEMSPSDAAGEAIDKFINFDISSHRIMEYLNDVGLLWFTKYMTRIPMVAAKAIKDKPIDSALAYLTAGHLGLDTIVDSAIPNIGAHIGTPVTAAFSSVDEIITLDTLGSILR